MKLPKFPAEDEPDGDVTYPHHFYIGIALAVFSFYFVWPHYPTTGAALRSRATTTRGCG